MTRVATIKRALSRIIQKLVNDNELVKTLYKEDMDTLPSEIVIGNENEFCVKVIIILIKDEKLSNILNMLHTREREVILLNIEDDISLDEVSRILDINYNTIDFQMEDISQELYIVEIEAIQTFKIEKGLKLIQENKNVCKKKNTNRLLIWVSR